MKCGNCKDDHETVAQVQSCYRTAYNNGEIRLSDEGAARIAGHRKPRPARTPMPDVPAGGYAVPSEGDNDLAFYKVVRPTEGKWTGWTFAKQVVGGQPDHPVRGRDATRRVLERIVKAGIKDAHARYGQELGECSECYRHLTDEESRRLGIGPVCRSK